MLRRRRRTDPNGAAKQHKIAFDHATTSPDTFRAASPEHPEAAMSPTSILQAMPPSPTTCGGGSTVPFFHGKNHHHHPWEAAAPVGLGLVGSLNKEGSDAKVLTGPKLRIQANEPCSPSTEFGSKNRSGTGAPVYADMVLLSPHRCPSPREMEMSEDYTCVITRGLNPRTTHIFDNCVVESCGFPTYWPGQGKDDFLRYCHGCSKDLGQGKDIFMYRGERAFCSRECRYREMLFDGDVEEC